ncbi:MAG: hypothetical protein CMN37_04770 [SAR116 cluster bacterium]|nr:hypothetical protein [SAR116 cluster bacterium]
MVSNLFIKGVAETTDLRKSLLPDFIAPSFSPIISLLLAAFLIIIIRKIFNITRWHGPPDAILAAHKSNNSIDIKSGFGSTLTAFISASGGASVGQYGPLVHFGATVATFLENFTSKRLPPGIFIGCGVAAAISAGFNAPIAGLVFAHEAVLRHFSLRAGGAIAISSITASTIGSGIFKETLGLKIISNAPMLIEIVPVVLICSPIFGILSIFFMYVIRLGAKLSKSSGLSFSYQIILAAIICGIIGIFIPEILGLGTNEMNNIFAAQYGVLFLLLILFGKIFMTSLCIGFGFFGGIFAPALYVGAAGGGFIAKLLLTMGFSLSLPALALAGTAAVGAVAIGAPIATTLIILEFTGSYEYAVAAMIAVQVSTFIAHRLYGDSLFDLALNDRGFKIGLGRQHIQMNDILIKDILSSDALTFDENETIEIVDSKMSEAEVTEAVIINDRNEYIGKISIYDLLKSKVKKQSPVRKVINQNHLVLDSEITLVKSIEEASNFVGEFIPVKNHDDNKYVGSINESDLFQAYLKLQNQVLHVEKDTNS